MTPGLDGQTTERRVGARRRLITGSVAALVLATTMLWARELVELIELPARDFAARVAAPRPETRVVVVHIDDGDYQRLFGARSPLDTAALGRLLTAVAAGRPAAIGVDLETSHPSEVVRVPISVPIVWARTALSCAGTTAPASDGPACESGVGGAPDGEARLVPQPVLGGVSPVRHTGLVMFPVDAHGVVRSYRRTLATTDGVQRSLMQELLCASRVRAADAAGCGSTSTEAAPARYIDFRPRAADDFRVLTAREIEDLAVDPVSDYRKGSIVGGKIVLVGGTYRAARDVYPTPLGPMAGVEIMAQAVETELSGGGPTRPRTSVLVASTLVLIATVLLTFHWFTFLTALGLCGVLLVTLVPLASLLVTGSPSVEAPFLVAVVGLVLLEQVIEVGNEYRKELLYHAAGRYRSHDHPREKLAFSALLARRRAPLDVRSDAVAVGDEPRAHPAP